MLVGSVETLLKFEHLMENSDGCGSVVRFGQRIWLIDFLMGLFQKPDHFLKEKHQNSTVISEFFNH